MTSYPNTRRNETDGLNIFRLLTGPLDVNCYILAYEGSGEAVIVDPGGPDRGIMGILDANGLVPVVVVNTHGHFDHVGGNAFLAEKFPGLEFAIHEDELPMLESAVQHAGRWGIPIDAPPVPGRLLAHGEMVYAGPLGLKVVHTPGHSPGSISLCVPGHVFTGDALFRGSIGRTDLPGGDFELLMASIRDRILSMPEDTLVHPGHGPESTVGMEKRHNPFLA